MKKISYLFMILFLASCGGSSGSFTSIKKPVSIALSTEDAVYQGRNTLFAYVADQFTQSVIVIDTLQEKILDTADGDEFDFSPIPVGGEPTAVVVDNGVTPQRIYVSDQLNNRIVAYDHVENATSEFVKFKPVDLGGATEGKSSRYLFKNSGSASSPTITNIVVNPDRAKNESWRLVYEGDKRYEVTGTVSGVQSRRAIEGKNYLSDNSEVGFFISAGGEKTTKGDEFFFGSVVSNPLLLATSPIDMVIKDRKLYILTKNTASVEVFNLDTLSIVNTVTLTDPSSVPVHMFLHGTKIYISLTGSGNIDEFDTVSEMVTSIPTTLSSISYVGADDDHLFLLQEGSAKLSVSDHAGVIEKTLNLNDVGTFFFQKTIDGKSLGFIPNISGNVDVVNLSTLERVDTESGDKPDFISPEFFDVGAESKPQLISVNGEPGVTIGETWQMIYDASDESYLLTGSKSGIQTNRVIPGEAYTSDNGEVSLRTRPSFAFPETEGDFFTFLTLDQIDPILISSQSIAVGGVSLTRVSDGKPMGYIIQQTSGQVSIVDLSDYNVKKTL